MTDDFTKGVQEFLESVGKMKTLDEQAINLAATAVALLAALVAATSRIANALEKSNED